MRDNNHMTIKKSWSIIVWLI